MNLYLHLTPDRPRPSDGPGRCRSRSSAPPPPRCWPTGSPATPPPAARSTCGPVLDLTDDTDPARRSTSTTHPPRCASSCVLRDAHCVFPGCRRDSRACDLDHITAYIPMTDGGPPGQTTPAISRPCADATTGSRPTPPGTTNALDGHGTYTWTAPTGHQYDRPPRHAAAHPTEEPDAPTPRPTQPGTRSPARGDIATDHGETPDHRHHNGREAPPRAGRRRRERQRNQTRRRPRLPDNQGAPTSRASLQATAAHDAARPAPSLEPWQTRRRASTSGSAGPRRSGGGWTRSTTRWSATSCWRRCSAGW